jgi:hypothetical protein
MSEVHSEADISRALSQAIALARFLSAAEHPCIAHTGCTILRIA